MCLSDWDSTDDVYLEQSCRIHLYDLSGLFKYWISYFESRILNEPSGLSYVYEQISNLKIVLNSKNVGTDII